MNLPVTQKHFLSFSRKLFLSVISLFLVFAICFIAYQYQREREYKIELLNTQLQDYNSRLYERLNNSAAIEEVTSKYIREHALQDLRVTLIDLQGNVIYDSYKNQNQPLESHLNRPEVQKALKEVQEAGCNALVVYLGNFGPETAETLLVKYFDGPCMVVAAAEEHGDNLVQGRGDA